MKMKLFVGTKLCSKRTSVVVDVLDSVECEELLGMKILDEMMIESSNKENFQILNLFGVHYLLCIFSI